MTGYAKKPRRVRFVIELDVLAYPTRPAFYLELHAQAVAQHLGGTVRSFELVAHDGKCKRPECGCVARDGKHAEIEALPESHEGTDVPVAGRCCSCGQTNEAPQTCRKREDKTHCNHWWDGSPWTQHTRSRRGVRLRTRHDYCTHDPE